MGTKISSKDFSESPIKIPQNPFWQVFKRFGRDEILAGIVNIISTFIVGFFTVSPLLLAFAGPVLEKIGFFPANFIEAKKIYKTTSKKQRKPPQFYFKLAMKNSSKSLLEDILIHDPLYVLFMFVGLLIYKSTPAWLLSFISFVVAVVIVSILEVAYIELSYYFLKRKLKRLGFEWEGYYETRFFIDSRESQKDVLKKLTEEFDLNEGGTLRYHDKYFNNELNEYSGRVAKIRLRFRNKYLEEGLMKTLQIVYTRARETSVDKLDQYRFFPIKKDKFYYFLEGKMPSRISEIKSSKIRKFLKSSLENPALKVDFERKYIRNEKLLITIDKIAKGENYYLLEIKTRKDIKLLICAMRYVMKEFPVVQTTKGKFDLEI